MNTETTKPSRNGATKTTTAKKVSLTPDQVAALKKQPLSESQTIQVYRILSSPPREATPRAKAAMARRKERMARLKLDATFANGIGEVVAPRG